MATKLPFSGNFRVTCEYGRKGKAWKSGVHQGIDLVGDTNHKVYSICNGVIERAGYDNSGFGNYVRIKESGTEKRIYLAHLSKIYVKVGQAVSYTTCVGLMGATGNANGAHTHVEIREFKNGVAVRKLNPATYMGIPNKVGSYNSSNYQINVNSNTNNTKTVKVFKVNTNIRENPSLSATAYLCKANTTVEILQENVGNYDGYIWDKVHCKAISRIGYVARTANRYK